MTSASFQDLPSIIMDIKFVTVDNHIRVDLDLLFITNQSTTFQKFQVRSSIYRRLNSVSIQHTLTNFFAKEYTIQGLLNLEKVRTLQY